MSLSFSLVPSALRRRLREAKFKRAHSRSPCFVPAKLHLLGPDVTIFGFVNEISRGGLRFRPAQSHILYRSGDRVRIEFGTYDLLAAIVNTHIEGYGLRLHDLLPESDVDHIASIKLPN